MKKKTLATAAVSMSLGAGLGMMFAPKKGEDLRKDLKNKLSNLACKIKKVDVLEIKEDLLESLNKIESDLEDLDTEKVKKIALKKAESIKKEIEKIIKIAKKKKDDVVREAAESLREKAICVIKEVLDRLED